MKVYYNSSLWYEGKGLSGVSQKVDLKFVYLNNNCYIPNIYYFSKGIVFDIITILDNEMVTKYFNKYNNIDKLTSLQKKCAESEHPYNEISFKEIFIDNKRVEGYTSSSFLCIPNINDRKKYNFFKNAYSDILNKNVSFACKRCCISYPDQNSFLERIYKFLRIYRIKNIKFTIDSVSKFIPLNIEFCFTEKDFEKQISFKHPETEREHIVHFKNSKNVEFSLGNDSRDLFYVVQADYLIDPSLNERERLQFNSSTQYTKLSSEKYMPTSTASIGIIGGSCGPTSVFSISKHNNKLSNCFSIPHIDKEQSSNFVIDGINSEICNEIKYNFNIL